MEPASAASVGTSAMRDRTVEGLIHDRLLHAYRLAFLNLGDEDDAKDATHDAAVAAWQQRRRLRDPARFPAWFDSIVLNRCRDRLRRRRRITFVQLAPDFDVADERKTDVDTAIADSEMIMRALERLSPDQRATIVLKYWDDLTIDQVARRLGVPVGTAKSRLHSALRVIRGYLQTQEQQR